MKHKHKKLFLKITQNIFLKTLTVVAIVLTLTWGITQATTSDFEQATKNFSVIGTVSSISEETISLIEARGSDTKEEDLYNLNIQHLKTVETKDYAPLIISDVSVGDTIVAQGVTDNSKFFITRIVVFSDIAFEQQIELPLENATSTSATSTDQTLETENATTTPDVATSTPEEDIIEDNATSTIDATTTPIEETSTSTDTASSTPSVIDTIIDVIEDGINVVIDTITSITGGNTGSSTQSTSTPVEDTPEEVIEETQETQEAPAQEDSVEEDPTPEEAPEPQQEETPAPEESAPNTQ